MHRISRAKLAINHFPIFRSILPAKAFSSRAKRKFFSLSSSPRYREAAFAITHLVDVMRQMPPLSPSLPPFSNIAFDFPRNFRFHRRTDGPRIVSVAFRQYQIILFVTSSYAIFLIPRGMRYTYRVPPYWNQCKYFTCTCPYISSLRDYIHMSDYMHM